ATLPRRRRPTPPSYLKTGLRQTPKSSLSRAKPVFFTPPLHGGHDTVTKVGNNARMNPRRSKALWAVAALLLVNAVLLAAPAGFALPGSLGTYFFGPKLVRADVLIKDGGALHLYRVDRGVIRSKANGALVLRERDGSLVTISVAPNAAITIGGQPAAYAALRKGMGATVIRDGDAPATEVRAGRG